jgi:hypothetical protein
MTSGMCSGLLANALDGSMAVLRVIAPVERPGEMRRYIV